VLNPFAMGCGPFPPTAPSCIALVTSFPAKVQPSDVFYNSVRGPNTMDVTTSGLELDQSLGLPIGPGSALLMDWRFENFQDGFRLNADVFPSGWPVRADVSGPGEATASLLWAPGACVDSVGLETAPDSLPGNGLQLLWTSRVASPCSGNWCVCVRVVCACVFPCVFAEGGGTCFSLSCMQFWVWLCC